MFDTFSTSNLDFFGCGFWGISNGMMTGDDWVVVVGTAVVLVLIAVFFFVWSSQRCVQRLEGYFEREWRPWNQKSQTRDLLRIKKSTNYDLRDHFFHCD